jgi:hypothetical protein
VRDPRDDELDRVLRGTFGRTRNPKLRKPNGSGLGDFDSENVSSEGVAPGVTYSGGPQTQQGGPKGRARREMERAWEGTLGRIDRSKCPPWFNEECFDALSRLLEETFRNFQLHTRRPSHIDPPFRATPIDLFPAAVVAIPGGGYGAGTYTPVTPSFRVPKTHVRGVLVAAGQSAESAAAFSDLSWRIKIAGTPHPIYNDFRIQLFQMVPPTPMGLIHLEAGQLVEFEAASLSAAAHSVMARLVGWHYPTRSEMGGGIGSTIVD